MRLQPGKEPRDPGSVQFHIPQMEGSSIFRQALEEDLGRLRKQQPICRYI